MANKQLVAGALLGVVLAIGACTTTEYVEVPVEVIREVKVPVETIREVEVIKEVPVEVIVEVEKPIEPYVPMYLDYVRWTSDTEDKFEYDSSRGYIRDVAWLKPVEFNYRTENNDLYLEALVNARIVSDYIGGIDVVSENFYLVDRDNEVFESSSEGWIGDDICSDIESISYRDDSQCWVYFPIPQELRDNPNGLQFVWLYGGNANPKSFNWEIAP